MPTGTREAIKGRLRSLIGSLPVFTGENEVSNATIHEAMIQAVTLYEKDFPQEVTEDEVGDSGSYYNLDALLTSWENDFSLILAIDYNAGTRVSSDGTPNYLSEDDGDFTYYRDGTARYIRFVTVTPTSSVTWRVTYTARHTLNANTSTIRATHEDAIIYLSMHKLLTIVSLKVEKALDSPAGAQFVSMRNKSSGMRQIAQDYLNMYYKEIGGIDGIHAVGFTKEYDLRPVGGDRSNQYLFHSGSLR